MKLTLHITYLPVHVDTINVELFYLLDNLCNSNYTFGQVLWDIMDHDGTRICKSRKNLSW